MFKNLFGEEIEHSCSVFPIITLNTDEGIVKCLGTGFFINNTGLFVTARHVLTNKKGEYYSDVFGTQIKKDGSPCNRRIDNVCTDDKTDIVVGMLRTEGYDEMGKLIAVEDAPFLQISFKLLSQGDEIIAFGYPKTFKSYPAENKERFHFTGTWMKGNIIEFYREGTPMLRNMCFQTSMHIQDGASGGPVFKGNYVVGVNSTGYELLDDEEPISFITPIHYLLNYQVEIDSVDYTIKQLMAERKIIAIT